jgi:hypothetical protein
MNAKINIHCDLKSSSRHLVHRIFDLARQSQPGLRTASISYNPAEKVYSAHCSGSFQNQAVTGLGAARSPSQALLKASLEFSRTCKKRKINNKVRESLLDFSVAY